MRDWSIQCEIERVREVEVSPSQRRKALTIRLCLSPVRDEDSLKTSCKE